MRKQQLPPGASRLKSVSEKNKFKLNLKSETTYRKVKVNHKSKTVTYSSTTSDRSFEKDWNTLVYVV